MHPNTETSLVSGVSLAKAKLVRLYYIALATVLKYVMMSPRCRI